MSKIGIKQIYKRYNPIKLRTEKELNMGYSEAIGNHRDIGTGSFPVLGNTAAKAGSTDAAVKFDQIIRDTNISGETAADSAPAESQSITFSAGADIERMGRMSQMKDLFFSEEMDLFAEDSDLDDAIGFDEIEELDLIADDEAANKAAEQPVLTDETSDFLTSVLTDDDVMLSFSDIEEM